MKKYLQPTPIDAATAACPATVIGTLLPERTDIPAEFKSHHNPYAQLATKWFFSGITAIAFHEHIDANTAGRHLQACLGSFEPKHQHKIAGVAYLMSLWGAREVTPEDDATQKQPNP